MANLIPALTFIMAVCIGMERLNLGSAAGQAKIIGTITGIAGAMVLTFVKGPEIHTPTHVNLLHPKNNTTIAASNGGGGDRRVLGSVCALGGGICYALWLIIQTKMSEKYPSYYSSTALMSLWAALLSTVFAVSVEKDWSQWKLGWNIRLLTVAYSGMVVSGMMVAVISWCVRMRGPLFASVFSPLMLVIIAIAGCTILNEKLHVGSIVGAVLIVCGLYAVLWGKSKEMKNTKKTTMSELPQCPHHDDDTVQVIVTRSNSKAEEDRSNNSNNNEQHHNNSSSNNNAANNNVVRDNNQDSSEEHGNNNNNDNNNNRVIARDEEEGEKEHDDDDEEGVCPNAEDIIPSVVI
ncbi:hypothetical protein PIB30_117849 [Stylosanthes scabra]|uniref:WAT1-related protein n=1 Tax=Stylosanthes scabra TaxID=79078 RepID=A0ABU6R559_9FABA|nr:hypothetical protein [Stylosanthes scabra]